MWLLALACTTQPEPADGVDIGTDTAAADSTPVEVDDTAVVVGDTGAPDCTTGCTPTTSLPIGEAPPAVSLIDINPNSLSYQQPIQSDKQRGVVTGWYYFKAS